MLKINIDRLPYKHRFAAASMLMSKGNRLTDLTSFGAEKKPSKKEIAKLREGLSYYDMALSLLKPHDPNYQTLVNWKCLALISLGQYRDAREWYEELVRADVRSQGEKARSATASLALEQIEALRDKENEPLPDVDPRDVSLFDDPPFCRVAEDFCFQLRDGKFSDAHRFLAPSLREEMTPDVLKRSFRALTGGAKSDVDVRLERYDLLPADSESNEVGWCYVAVESETASEAISLGFGVAYSHVFEIRSIEFGRP